MLLSSFGAVPDAKVVRHASMAAGSATLTSAVAQFTANDVGKLAVVAGAGAGKAKLATTVAAFVSPTQVTLATPAASAVPDVGASIGTDCGPALQAAFDALEASAGGTLVIDGVFLLRTPAQMDAQRAQDVRIIGTGGDSGIVVAGAPDATMIRINNVGRLLFNGINMAGTHEEPDDCLRVFHLSNCFARFEGCGFFGLACINSYGAGLIYNEVCDLVLRDNEFGGCVFSSGRDNAVVRSTLWMGFSDEGSRWIDYGSWGGEYYSKTGLAFSGAWVALGVNRNPAANATSQSVARFTDSRFDEGHVAAIAVNVGNGPRINRVHLDGVQVNNTLIDGGTAFYLRGVDHVLIEQCAVGWVDAPRNAITLLECGNVVVERLLTNGGAGGLSATGVDSILLRDSPTLTRFTLANVGRFAREDDGAGGQVLFSKAGRITDADFPVPPPIGTPAFDEASGKLYVKGRAGWLATAALAPSTDPLFALRNLTPATGQVVNATRFNKTGGAASWSNCGAVLDTVRTGSFRMRVRFPVGAAGTYARAGALAADLGANAQPTDSNISLGLLQDDGNKVYLVNGGGLPAGPWPYTAGQECEVTWNAVTGATVVKINGAQVYAGNLGASPDFQHHFATTLANVGAAVELIEYAAL